VLRRLLRYTAGRYLSIVVKAAPALAAALLIVVILHSGFSRGYSDWVWLFLAIVIGFATCAPSAGRGESRAQRLGHQLETPGSPGI